MTPFELNGKIILITGASSGIGKQCAITCSNMGARVLLFGRNNDRLSETLTEMSKPEMHSIYSVDITNQDVVNETLKKIKQSIGSIDGIINCAGISTTLPIKYTSEKKIQEFFEINVFGTFSLTRSVLTSGLMNINGGSIIFLTSVMSMVGEVGKSLYSMTKGALLSGSRSLALELARKKIRINTVSPGVVMTPMSMNSFYSKEPELLEKVEKLHPLGLGNVEDVANACVFLLSDASKWVTGTNMVIDGGYTAR